MRWPWSKVKPPSEATRAREQAERDLIKMRAETSKYRELAESLRDLRERNHFADAIAHNFRGGRA